MTASAPWSVKGIDAKAREVAKDLARRSGMTLGEWLNQMILEGEDVAALISREKNREAKVEVPRADIRDRVRSDRLIETYDEDYAPARRAAPYSSAASTASVSRTSAADLRRGSIFADRPRDTARESVREMPRYAPREDVADGDLGRVARALENLGSRIETSETRSAGAVRSVSQVVESLLGRVERSEAAHSETREALQERLAEQSNEFSASFERLNRTEEDQSLFAERLEQAERLIDAQAERLEGISGNLREERERIARIEQKAEQPKVVETIHAIEGALGKLANQLYEGEARSRDTLTDVRSDMVGLSHRVAQVELRDPDRSAQILIDKVVAQLAQRLETAEAQTNGAIKTLEHAFKTLEGRMNKVEEGGDISDPAQVASLTNLAADLSRRVEESRQDMLRALQSGKQETIELAVKVAAERIDQSEKRSAGAIEKMGQDVLRMADNLNRRMTGVETTSHAGIARVRRDLQQVADSVVTTIDSRIGRIENSHSEALQRLGGEIARISERLNQRLHETERRAVEVLGGVGEQIVHQRDLVRDDIDSRMRESEERTARLLEDARQRIDARLAQVQTEKLAAALGEAPVPHAPLNNDLPNPFDHGYDDATDEVVAEPTAAHYEDDFADDEVEFEAENAFAPPAAEPEFVAEDRHVPGFDPFEEDGLESDLVRAESHAAPAQFSAPVEDDADPFADIDSSRKMAPGGFGRGTFNLNTVEPQPAPRAPTAGFGPSPFGDDDEAPVSVSTRDALKAARAAVLASVEGEDSALGNLRSGPSRARRDRLQPLDAPKQGGTMSMAIKASAVAVLAVGGLAGAYKGLQFLDKPKAESASMPIAANLTVDGPMASQSDLKTRFDAAMKAVTAGNPKGVDLLKTVANQGFAPAQYELHRLYYGNGQPNLIKVDKPEARLWAQRAAEGGEPNAMNNLALMYYNGEGGPQNRPLAAMWFRKAAERGIDDSQFNLGMLYSQGDQSGIPINPSEAYKWLKIAATGGDKEAAKQLADVSQKLTDAQRQRADAAAAQFTPISDGAPPMSHGAAPGSEPNG